MKRPPIGSIVRVLDFNATGIPTRRNELMKVVRHEGDTIFIMKSLLRRKPGTTANFTWSGCELWLDEGKMEVVL